MDRSLRLLGVPQRLGAEEPLELPPGQVTHLAALLAIRADWVAREELAALFWPDAEPRRGRHNLAQLLYAIRRAPWGEGVEAEPSRVRWQVPTDVAAFRRAASDGAWEEAAERYAGDLLEGVTEPSSQALVEWLRAEREDLRETWTEALHRRAEALAAAGRWQECARLLRRLLTNDVLLEGAVQALIRAEAMAGRRDAALQVYEEFRQRLDQELGLDPLEATAELASAVRSGALAPCGAEWAAGADGDHRGPAGGTVRGARRETRPGTRPRRRRLAVRRTGVGAGRVARSAPSWRASSGDGAWPGRDREDACRAPGRARTFRASRRRRSLGPARRSGQ